MGLAGLKAAGMKFYRICGEEDPIRMQYERGLRAGFPSPAADYSGEEIDLNQLLRPHPASTFLVRVEGDSMTGAHIPDQALLVVDRSVTPVNNSIVVAVVNGEFTVKTFICNSSGIRLLPANPRYPPIPVTEGMDFSVWGTVTKVIIDTLKP